MKSQRAIVVVAMLSARTHPPKKLAGIGSILEAAFERIMNVCRMNVTGRRDGRCEIKVKV